MPLNYTSVQIARRLMHEGVGSESFACCNPVDVAEISVLLRLHVITPGRDGGYRGTFMTDRHRRNVNKDVDDEQLISPAERVLRLMHMVARN